MGLAIAPSTSAVAADGVQVSPDGVSYSTGFSGSVLTDVSRMVPGESQGGFFYVRNASSNPGFMRIVLKDIAYSDVDFANAVTMTARTADQQGEQAPVTLADPCWVLLEGAVVAGGASVRVDLVAALGDLDGTRGQGATASASLGVALSDMTPGGLAPTDCGGSAVDVPLTPTRSSATVANPGDPAARASGTVGPGVGLPVLNLPELPGIDPNTWHLWEELFVLLLLLSCTIGGLVFAFVARQRRRHDDDHREDLA